MLELIERLEKAESGSRDLDAWVWKTVHDGLHIESVMADCLPGVCVADDGTPVVAGPVTNSLDAIVALIGEALPGHDWSIGNLPTSDDADHEEHHEFGCLLYEAPHVASPRDGLGHGATAPLAACIALLRSLSNKESGNGG